MTETLPKGTTVRRRDHVAELETAESVILLAMDAPRCNPFRLTGGGILIWRNLTAEPRDAHDLIDAVAEQAGATTSEIAPAVLLFLAELVGLELVEAGPATA